MYVFILELKLIFNVHLLMQNFNSILMWSHSFMIMTKISTYSSSLPEIHQIYIDYPFFRMNKKIYQYILLAML